MTIESNDKRELIKHRLDQADETIEDVRILIENNRFRTPDLAQLPLSRF